MEHAMRGPSQSFCSLVDEALLKKQKESQEKPDQYFPLRPSSAGYCARKLAYELAAFEGLADKIHEARPASVIRLLSLGNGIEWHVLKYLETITSHKIRYKQQVVSLFNLPSGRLIEGSVDAVMMPVDPKKGTPGVLDVKSKGDGWSVAYKTRWEEEKDRYSRLASVEQFEEDGFYIKDVIAFLNEVGEDALVANITQINSYIGSDFMQERGADWGSILRYNKNNSKHIEVRFAYSPALFALTKKKFSDIENAVLKKKKPELIEKEFVLGSQACGFCPYQGRCWPDVDAKRAHFKTYPKKQWATKVAELEGAPALRDYFSELDIASAASSSLDNIETKILKEMESHDVRKIMLDDGRIYEAVFLKSPKPHLELRRSKM